MAYLEWDDPKAYEGLEKRNPTPYLKYECLKCKGFGGWILRPNAYGEGRHYKTSCSNCNGWGYTSEEENHIHDWDYGKTIGNCLTEYTCSICNTKWVVDSSD